MKNTNTNTTSGESIRARILGQYASLEDFGNRTGIDMAALTGAKEFVLEDIVKIRIALHLNDDETKRIFFPDMEPEGKKTAMANLLEMQTVIERLENIEKGMIALDLMATGQIKNVGDTVTNEDFQDGFRFIMAGILEQMIDLRADLTGKYARHLRTIGQ